MRRTQEHSIPGDQNDYSEVLNGSRPKADRRLIRAVLSAAPEEIAATPPAIGVAIVRYIPLARPLTSCHERPGPWSAQG